MRFLVRRKSIDTITQQDAQHRLKATLSWWHLVAMGVGAIVGTGIYTLTGIGAGLAGPGVILSFLICGVICGAAALCYAEMATMMPAAGSAYTYTYAVLGEFLAWIVGWALILEYTVGSAAVAVGWSAHVAEFIRAAGWHFPTALSARRAGRRPHQFAGGSHFAGRDDAPDCGHPRKRDRQYRARVYQARRACALCCARVTAFRLGAFPSVPAFWTSRPCRCRRNETRRARGGGADLFCVLRI